MNEPVIVCTCEAYDVDACCAPDCPVCDSDARLSAVRALCEPIAAGSGDVDACNEHAACLAGRVLCILNGEEG